MRKFLALLAALSAGCSMVIGHERVEGWPELEIVEHKRLHCAGYDHVVSTRGVSAGAGSTR